MAAAEDMEEPGLVGAIVLDGIVPEPIVLCARSAGAIIMEEAIAITATADL
jgi:hypothetical protein